MSLPLASFRGALARFLPSPIGLARTKMQTVLSRYSRVLSKFLRCHKCALEIITLIRMLSYGRIEDIVIDSLW